MINFYFICIGEVLSLIKWNSITGSVSGVDLYFFIIDTPQGNETVSLPQKKTHETRATVISQFIPIYAKLLVPTEYSENNSTQSKEKWRQSTIHSYRNFKKSKTLKPIKQVQLSSRRRRIEKWMTDHVKCNYINYT